jgi:phosphomannomutase (EC 5.4.2.8)
MVAAFTDGVTAQGLNVIDIGLCSTDMMYFASGHLNLPRHGIYRQPQPSRLQRY